MVTLKGTQSDNQESLRFIAHCLSTDSTTVRMFYLCPNVLPLSKCPTPVQMFYLCLNVVPLSKFSTSVQMTITAALSTSISHVLTLSKGSNSVHMPHPCWRNLLLSTSYTPLLMFYLFSHGLPLSTCFTSVYPLLCPANQQVGPPPTPTPYEPSPAEGFFRGFFLCQWKLGPGFL